MSGGVDIRVLDDLAELETEWSDLVAASDFPSVFQTWEWVSSWRETLGSEHGLIIATARRSNDGLLLGVAPMAIARHSYGPLLRYLALEFVGAGRADADHLDVIVQRGREDLVAPLWDAVGEVGGWYVVALDELRSGSHLADLIRASYEKLAAAAGMRTAREGRSEELRAAGSA